MDERPRDTVRQRSEAPTGVRQFVLRGDADSAAGAARRRCSRSTAFAGEVDDIADSAAAAARSVAAELAAWRADIEALYAGGADRRERAALATPVRDFGLEQADFLAVIDGMEMDVRADIRAPAWSDLDLYCDRVASAVGRLSVTDVRP